MSRILIIDIETKPNKAYVWKFWDETVGQDQIIEDGGIIMFGAKWLGEKDMIYYTEWDHGRGAMLAAAHDLMSEADAIVTYNGDKFDLPKLYGEFALIGLPPPPPWTSVDVYKTVKKFGLPMNRLGYVGPRFGLGNKLKNDGFRLWKGVMDGDPKAEKKMVKYCLRDVKLLEELYKLIRPYIREHPHMGEAGANTCGACGSRHLQRRGFRRTRCFQIQRLQCQDCGAWSSGARKKVGG